MEIIQPIKEYITICRKDDYFNDDSDCELIKFYFIQNKLNIPDNIQKLICNDYLYFEKIIKLYQDKFIKYRQNDLSFDICLEKLSEKIIVNINSDNKIKYNNFYKDIFSWLIEINFFTKLSEKINVKIDFSNFRYNNLKEILKDSTKEINSINKCDNSPIIINMKNYVIENKKNGDKLLRKVK